MLLLCGVYVWTSIRGLQHYRKFHGTNKFIKALLNSCLISNYTETTQFLGFMHKSKLK
jgi:hypothetical protein